MLEQKTVQSLESSLRMCVIDCSCLPPTKSSWKLTDVDLLVSKLRGSSDVGEICGKPPNAGTQVSPHKQGRASESQLQW